MVGHALYENHEHEPVDYDHEAVDHEHELANHHDAVGHEHELAKHDVDSCLESTGPAADQEAAAPEAVAASLLSPGSVGR